MRCPLSHLLSLLGLILLLSGCAAWQPRLEQPNINLVGLEIREFGLLRQRYLITLNVQNPNSMAIPVRGINYAVRIAGDEFAQGVSPTAFTVPGYGETDVEVEMTTNLISTLHRVQELLSGSRDVIDYQLSGKLEVDMPLVRAIPFNNRGEFRLTN